MSLELDLARRRLFYKAHERRKTNGLIIMGRYNLIDNIMTIKI